MVVGSLTALPSALLRWRPLSQQWTRALVLALLARHTVLRPRRQGSCSISIDQRNRAVGEIRRLVPAPPAFKLGGERVTADTYCRFLAVCEWDAERAAKLLQKDLKWRAKYRPRALRPSDMPHACSQAGWTVLMSPIGGRSQSVADTGSDSSSGSGSHFRARFWRHAAAAVGSRSTLNPPHTRPPMQHWRCTRTGMPITYFQAKQWTPERVPRDERVRHVAYQMEHYIRRMPHRGHRGARVQRACIVLDMSGFRPTTLPQIKECIDVLRNHYPGRLGVAAFINVPPYFHPVWKIISPLLDEEVSPHPDRECASARRGGIVCAPRRPSRLMPTLLVCVNASSRRSSRRPSSSQIRSTTSRRPSRGSTKSRPACPTPVRYRCT